MLIIIRFIISLIIYIILLILAHILPDNYTNSFIKTFNKLVLNSLGFHTINYNYEKSLIQKYNHKFIIVFNHVSFCDGWVLWSVFGKVGTIINTKTLKNIPFSEYICEKYGCIMIDDKSKNTTQKILESKEPYIALAPDSMQYPTYPNNIGDFKTGAFVPKLPILPIIIKYKDCAVFPDYKYEIGESSIHSFFKHYLNWNAKIDVNIMDMIYPKETWSIEEYKNHVKNEMEIAYNQF
tara:strand:- start:13322 stop:14032 length:711 start_codon:yes stop_codon:yes gene_type:complete